MMKKTIAILLACAMLLVVFAGCGDSTESSSAEDTTTQVASSADEENEEVTEESEEPVEEDPAAEEPVEEAPMEEEAPEAELSEEAPEEAGSGSLDYPLSDGSETVTMWVSMPSQISPYMEDVADSAAYRAASEATGIQLVTTTVSTEAQDEQFQLIMASGGYADYDVIIGAAASYGSADAAVEDEILLDVSGYVEEYMPDFYRFLQDDEEVRKLLTTDEGAMVNIAGRGAGGRPQGFGIRKDWLDDAGLDIPTTYDELHDVLTVFKNQYDCAEPLLMYSTGFLDNNFLCAGLGVTQDGYYVSDGEVLYCYTEESFKNYCEMMAEWYAEGLFSKDFLNNVQGAGTSYDAQMLDGTAGVFMTGVDIFSSSSYDSAEDPNWNAVPMADITVQAGDTITLGITPSSDPLSNCWNITTGVTEDHLPIVLGYVNWFFTEDGSIACNFGIEGEGFEYVDGEPRLTDLVTNNPGGLTSFVTEAMYLNWNACFCLDDRYYLSVYDTDAQAEATTIWNSNRNNSQQYHGDMSADESSRYAALYSDIETYISTASISFITGTEDVNAEWDTFVSTIEDMGINECIEIKQAAYDRYVSR